MQTAWRSTKETKLKKFYSQQKQALRIIFNKKKIKYFNNI